MGHLHAAALAIHLGPGVRAIEPNVLDLCIGHIAEQALTPLVFQPLPDVLIDLDVPGEIELPGLDHGACDGGGIAAAFQLDGVEEGAVGHVIVRVDLKERHIPWLEFDDVVWPGAHGLQIVRRVARAVALCTWRSGAWAGCDHSRNRTIRGLGL
jgi:hypothetical protein